MGREFWSELPLHDDAYEIFDLCRRYVGREHICFLTSPCLTDGCIDGKRDWAYEHFPGVPILFSMAADPDSGWPSYPPKSFVAHSRAILIDDHTKNVLEWTKNDGAGYLLPRRWNRAFACEGNHSRLENFLERICEGHLASVE